MKLRYGASVFIFALLAHSPAWGDDHTLPLASVLRTVLNTHPDLALARVQQQEVRIEHGNIEGLLDSQISVASSISDETTPTTSIYAPSGINTSLISGSIIKPLNDGSTLTAQLSYSRSFLRYPDSPFVAQLTTINPAYQHQIDLIYRYPLLRGKGNVSYNEQMTGNRYNEDVARWSVVIEQEQLAAQAINLYYQIAADDLAVKLAQDAILRAKQLLTYQKQREQFGLIEKAERLQADALLSSRNMEHANALAALTASVTALNRLMLRSPDAPIHVELQPVQNTPLTDDIETLLQQALLQRPVFRLLKAQQSANQAALELAYDQHNTQIDIISQVGSRALSNSPGESFRQGFTLQDRFISIGIELSDTLGGKSTKAGIQKAELERERTSLQHQQALEVVKTDLSTALTNYHNSNMTRKSVLLHQQAEKQKFLAEMRRYREGRSDTATLVQFEGDLRTAELQAALQLIQTQLAVSQLALATGDLLHDLKMLP